MSKRKICVVITARPSYSRVKTLFEEIKDDKDLDLFLIVSGSALLDRFGSVTNVIEKDGFQISAKLFTIIDGENLTSSAKTAGLGILELSTIFSNIQPDIVITIADRYETISTAISAAFMNIPLAHIQGGEVTGNIDEKVRHSITKLSDIHFVASEDALKRVIKLGEDPSMVFNTGCPSIDIAHRISDTVLDFDPIEKYGGVGNKEIDLNNYLIVMQHPVTTEFNSARYQIEETLYAINDLCIPTLWFWPNIDAGSDSTSKGIRSFREKYNPTHIHFFKNIEPTDFLKLLKFSKCLVGNSSVGIRECSYLGVPVVNIGSRQNARERGNNVIDCNYNRNEIKECINHWLNCERPKQSTIYGDGYAGKKIVSILKTVPLKYHKTITY